MQTNNCTFCFIAALLQGWADNIGRLLELVEKSTMNIQKEAMTHKVTLVSANFGG